MAVRIAYRVRIMDAKFQVEVRPIDVSKIKTECVTNLTNVRITYRKKKKEKKQNNKQYYTIIDYRIIIFFFFTFS